MAKIYYEKDADLKVLQGKRIAILGYGIQGRGHALNLRDSGLDVVVAQRPGGAHYTQAIEDGFQPTDVAQAAREAQVIMVLLQDTLAPEVYKGSIAQHLKAGKAEASGSASSSRSHDREQPLQAVGSGAASSSRSQKALAFAHGFNIHFQQIKPPKEVDVFLVAPKGPGSLVRQLYLEGGGVPSLFAVYQDASGQAKEIALAYAKGLGSTKAGVLETTFAEETETDLFGEQTVLCGGVSELIRAGFETLVEKGYQPELAYFECLHELKLIVDMIYQNGIQGMWPRVSETARYGGLTRGGRVITEATRAEMRKILEEIRSGSFAKEWVAEAASGRKNFQALMNKEERHLIEIVGERLRSMMPWIDPQKIKVKERIQT